MQWRDEVDEETRKKVDAEIANIIATSGKLNAETGKISAEKNRINAEIEKMGAEVAKMRAEVAKITSENKYYPIIVTATATLAIVGLARLF